ncbi:MAG: DUF2239 family protein [Micropepsaceae bacterium]
MSDPLSKICTVFDGTRRVATGPLSDVATSFKRAIDKGSANVFLFDDATGRAFDIDIRGTEAEMLARLRHSFPLSDDARGPGRPKLGVVSREVTLLPAQWDWLAAQPGGASVTLRKLVDEARRNPKARARAARDASYGFMSAMAGDREGFEEASRALFAGDREKLKPLIARWPKDIREHVLQLAFGGADA